MSKKMLEKCPNCEQELRSALYSYLFGKLAGSARTFEYKCQACGAALEVEAVPQPEFWCTLQSVPAVTISGLYNCNVCGEEKCKEPGICEDCPTVPTE
jgi:hypothetical protein